MYARVQGIVIVVEFIFEKFMVETTSDVIALSFYGYRGTQSLPS